MQWVGFGATAATVRARADITGADCGDAGNAGGGCGFTGGGYGYGGPHGAGTGAAGERWGAGHCGAVLACLGGTQVWSLHTDAVNHAPAQKC